MVELRLALSLMEIQLDWIQPSGILELQRVQ